MATVSSWQRYLEENVDASGRHKRFTGWTVIGVWTFRHDDGRVTPHKNETPYATWREACEQTMCPGVRQSARKDDVEDMSALIAMQPIDKILDGDFYPTPEEEARIDAAIAQADSERPPTPGSHAAEREAAVRPPVSMLLREARDEVPSESAWRHTKTGNLYCVRDAALLQIDDEKYDCAPVVIYESFARRPDGTRDGPFVRPLDEFLARFTQVPA